MVYSTKVTISSDTGYTVVTTEHKLFGFIIVRKQTVL